MNGNSRSLVRLLAGGVAVAVVGLLAVASPPHVTAADSVRVVTTLEADVLSDVNHARARAGLVPLKVNVRLGAAAREHSLEMARRGYFSHASASGEPLVARVTGYYLGGRHVRYWSVGENLLWRSPDTDAATALQMWLDSPPHKANLLTARWREIGISAVHTASAPGAYAGREVTIVTTDFGVIKK